jgi:hypothetical protein
MMEKNPGFEYGKKFNASAKGHDNYGSSTVPNAGMPIPAPKTGQTEYEIKTSPRQVFPNGIMRTEPTGVSAGEHGYIAKTGDQERRANVYEQARNVDNFPSVAPQSYEGLNETVTVNGIEGGIKVLPHESEIVEKEFHRSEVSNKVGFNVTSAQFISKSAHPAKWNPTVQAFLEAEESGADVDKQSSKVSGEFKKAESRLGY